jgi:hypothetical protein
MQIVSAEDPGHIISNSKDWRDVYSAMLYGSLTGTPTSFLVSDRHGTLMLNSISKSTHVWSLSSERNPYIVGYQSLIDSRGYSAEEFRYDNMNLELARQLGLTKFVIIDDSYGYNAISVAPYAVATDSFVLFVDSNNVREIDSFLEDNGVEEMIIYGHVDREVKERFEKYDPEIINFDGDRFANNIAIVEKYQETQHARQAILTNGEFIEKEIMSGVEPVIFIGSNNVPDIVRDYIQESDIQIGILIGNELVGTATFIRRQVGISVFVKFAQGARAPQGAISQVEALDMFYLPVYILNLEVDSVSYNKLSNELEVTFRNTEEQAVYFKGTYTVTASDGTVQTIGDVDTVFIDGNELKTITYPLEALPEGDIIVDLFVIYGESKNALEKELRERFCPSCARQVEVIEVLDNCDVEITGVVYDKRRHHFDVRTVNKAKVDCYVDVDLLDVIVAGETNTFSLERVTEVKAGRSEDLRIKARLEEEDFPDNEIIRVKAYYGERPDRLVRIFEGQFALMFRGIDYLFWSLMVVIIILVILIIWRRYKNRRNRYDY